MRSRLVQAVVVLLASSYFPGQVLAEDEVIRACAQKRSGILRLSPLGQCRQDEVALSWNIQGPAGPPGLEVVGSVAFLESSGAITAVAGGAAVEIPGLGATIPLSEGSMLWVQGDFHEHRFCDGYLDRSHTTESWALDLEVDGVIVASREMRGEQGNLFNHESKPFTWISDPLASGDHSIRFLLRPPSMDTVSSPPNQAKICLGTDGTDERQSRVVLFEIPG